MITIDDTITLVYRMFRAQFDLSVERLRQGGQVDLAEKMQRRWYAMFYNDPLHTLKKGKAYLIGLNPGGTDDYEFYGREEINVAWWENAYKTLGGKPYSSYIDEEWSRGKGNSPHQISVRRVLHHIIQGDSEEADTRSTCAANLCFYRTPDENELALYPPEIVDCWWFHQLFLSIVRPEIIVCNGCSEQKISAFSEMKRYLAPSAEIQKETVNEKRSVKWFRSKLVSSPNKESVLVLGIPHLSRPYASMEDILSSIDRILGR